MAQLDPAQEAFRAEVARRIAINEGCRLTRYQDSLGIWTIGVGFNCERADAGAELAAVGARLADVMADRAIAQAQAQALFERCLSGLEAAARSSLAAGAYDALTGARRFVLLDLEYNLGSRGWLGFETTRAIISEAQAQKGAGRVAIAHQLFMLAGDHLAASAWNGQVGQRAARDIAMIRTGDWVPTT